MDIELRPGQPAHSARLTGCTCTWLRGFGVWELHPEDWNERIICLDLDCSLDHSARGDVIDES